MKEKIYIISGGSSSIFQKLLSEKYFVNEKIFAIYNSSKKIIKNKNINYLKFNYTKKVNLKKHIKIIKSYKKIIFINFASNKTNKTFLNISNDEFLRDFKINTLSYFDIAKIVLPLMIKNNWGRIINISSTGGIVGDKGTILYSMSKNATLSMMKVMSKEYGRFNITFNTLKLGNFNHGLFKKLDKNFRKKLLEKVPSKKTGNIKNILYAIDFLIKTDYINGSSISIDGGLDS